MVLAQRVELDVGHQHHLLVLDVKQGVVDHLLRVGVVAGQQFLVHAGHALRRLEQAVTIRILPHRLEQRAHRLFDGGTIHAEVEVNVIFFQELGLVAVEYLNVGHVWFSLHPTWRADRLVCGVAICTDATIKWSLPLQILYILWPYDNIEGPD